MEYKKINIITFMGKMVEIIPGHTIFYVLSQGVGALLPALQTMAVALFVNNVIASDGLQTGKVISPLLLIMFCILFQNVIPVITRIVNTSKKNRLTYSVNLVLLRKQMKLAYRNIEDSDTCDLIYRVRDNCVNYFDEGYMNVLNSFALAIKLVSLMIIIFRASIISGIMILLIVYPLLKLAMKTGSVNYSLEQDAEMMKRRYNYIFSVLTGKDYANERNLFGYTGTLTQKYNRLFDDSLEKETKIINKRYANMKSGSVITLIISICVMAFMLPQLFRNEITPGLYVGLAGAILDLIQSMSWQLAGMMQNYAKLSKFFDDYNTFIKLDEQDGAENGMKKNKDTPFVSLEFRDVSFRYPGTDKYVLKNCSFNLTGKHSYAVVGENGAGKTTLAKLIMGLYDGYEGEIYINGRNMKEYTYSELKGIVGTVFQDFAKYELSIKENIGIGDVDYYIKQGNNESEIQSICERLDMIKWINELPNGFGMMLGKIEEEGVDLSGGQWQKMAIARLLYKDAEINILDEPTAAMDAIAESKVYEQFKSIFKGRFNILITHRMGAARIADEILVIKNGKVIEQGKHEFLVGIDGGVYKEMFESQRKWYE